MSTDTSTSTLRQWTTWVPVVALVALAFGWGRDLPALGVTAVALCLFGAVLAAVHHAEVVAHRVGEPLGSLVLAVAVTIIEVGLIVMLMSGGGDKASTYARDTVFAAVMITCNGIVGICLLVGAVRNRTVVFNAEGSGGALATVITLASMTLVLPTFTTGAEDREFTTGQLAFAAVASLGLYLLFVTVQTVRHRDYFLPVSREDEPPVPTPADPSLAMGASSEDASGGDSGDASGTGEAARQAEATGAVSLRKKPCRIASPDGSEVEADPDSDVAVDENGEEHAPRPSSRAAGISLLLLVVSLIAVVGNAKVISPTIEQGVESAGLPYTVVGVVIALMVLLPETLSAVRSARRDRMQTSLNLAYGSAIASIGLTVPTIALASVWLSGNLELGLTPIHLVLLALTAVVSALTVVPGRATLLQGGVHLALFSAFLFLSVSP
ncbi:ionic transporter y4hA [Streptomyces sp. NPDC005805]|uniref:calcium:proton antiporter n=1 Tax=Streptomyces sp. NPDC005805 TaxID=3157068 RepID=UPI0033E942A7